MVFGVILMPPMLCEASKKTLKLPGSGAISGALTRFDDCLFCGFLLLTLGWLVWLSCLWRKVLHSFVLLHFACCICVFFRACRSLEFTE